MRHLNEMCSKISKSRSTHPPDLFLSIIETQNSELRIIYLTLYIHNVFYNNTIQYNTVQFMIVFVMFPFGQGDSHLGQIKPHSWEPPFMGSEKK